MDQIKGRECQNVKAQRGGGNPQKNGASFERMGFRERERLSWDLERVLTNCMQKDRLKTL